MTGRNLFATTNARVVGAFCVAALLHLAGTVLIPGYSAPFAIRAMLVLASLLAVASIGQTLVVIMGGIDLSIPFVIGFANVVAAQLYGDGWNFVLVCGLVGVLALVIGGLNGLISRSLDIQPLIVTLGIGMVVQGLVLLWTAGFPSGSAPQAVSSFVSIGGSAGPLPVPWLVPSLVVLAALVVLVLERTPYGRRLYALGSNPGAAPLALIDPVRMWVITYAASAFFAAVAGVLLLGFTGSAYGDVGQPYLFQTIAAVVVGGAALVGGRGSYLGTIAGVLVLTEINTLLIGLGFQPAAVQAALGFVIVLLVSLYGRERHVSTTI
ncbi:MULTISPECIES: ABC transporter permease [unclassified Mesorhizobium]|uniref:ABC transporter permease n=1 Tax=unclassified Mesorhizobium TaxID=325217 RepID=UPI000FD2CA20|nr:MULTISPECIES: ABC transporter permease [unclassified Mesorhizobium]AZV23342.1 ABC transporter permease [Mesorhizobium sp. M7A.F.Ce.TU.012.03.2.1]RUU91801.1 ABC transporter permease [Mesorhizobium sp. M7A.F.Ca.MR.176.00.0.0]RWO87612.1 MAG: ABC transporter permease [Mesorhizobium sp.]TIM22737.1 MAG: ABC transporter permease [Mesorhizobium sp.]TIM97214.1 MAG: ABC transporter permease [Mesorhizobium sp.]